MTPPGGRDPELCDACTKTHINDDAAEYYDYALATLIKFQLHDHICTKILKQDVRACDYSGNKEVGAFLKGILSLGATRDWRTGDQGRDRRVDLAARADGVLRAAGRGPREAQRRKGLRALMARTRNRRTRRWWRPPRRSTRRCSGSPRSRDGLRKGSLDSQRNLERAAEALNEVAGCEEELQAHAQALMAALGSARDAQQAQAEAVRVRALEIQARTEELARLMRGFEAIGKDAAALNASAQQLAARKRTPDEMVKDGELLAGLDELQERMTAVLTSRREAGRRRARRRLRRSVAQGRFAAPADPRGAQQDRPAQGGAGARGAAGARVMMRVAALLGLALLASAPPEPPPGRPARPGAPGTTEMPPRHVPHRPRPRPPIDRQRGVALGLFAEDVSFSYGPLLAEIVARRRDARRAGRPAVPDRRDDARHRAAHPRFRRRWPRWPRWRAPPSATGCR